MKTKLNSNLFPIINVGMYDSYLSPEFVLNDDIINEDNKEGYICYNSEFFNTYFDYNKYKQTIIDYVIQFLSEHKEELKPILSNIKVGDIYSPKYYNFATDNIDLTVIYNKRKLIDLVKNDLNFGIFLKENYSSCDGFISFTSNNHEDWLIKFNQNNDQEIGAILTYLLKDIDIPDFIEWFGYEEQPFYSEYITEEGYALINEVEEFIKQSISKHHINGNLNTILSEVKDMLIDSSLDNDFDCKEYIKTQIKLCSH